MRQIRPRNTRPALARQPDTTQFLVDLRDGGELPETELRAQLADARQAVRDATRRLATLIDERDALRRQLEVTAPSPADPEDHTIVAWGFFDDDLG